MLNGTDRVEGGCTPIPSVWGHGGESWSVVSVSDFQGFYSDFTPTSIIMRWRRGGFLRTLFFCGSKDYPPGGRIDIWFH